MSIEYKVTNTYTTVRLVQLGTESKERKEQKIINFSVEGSKIPEIGDIFVLVPKKKGKNNE